MGGTICRYFLTVFSPNKTVESSGISKFTPINNLKSGESNSDTIVYEKLKAGEYSGNPISPQIFGAYIWKEGHLRRNWKLRYFVLIVPQDVQCSSLIYFVGPSEKYPFGEGDAKGELSLKGISLKVDGNILRLSDSAGKRYLNMRLPNPFERSIWINKFNLHIAFSNPG